MSHTEKKESSSKFEMKGDIDALCRSLPYLPGYCFKFKENPNFRKSHAFDYINDVSIFREEAQGIGGIPLPGQTEKILTTSADLYKTSNHNTGTVPAWIAFDRKVLRFYAYFQEAVQEKREEQYRIRKVNILFYLEDDTIHVIEPRRQNSGIPQGTLIRRHRIPLPGQQAHDQQYYLFTALNVNKEVTFYARTFKIVGCDTFTRVAYSL
ncbi:EF-hand domain-containing member C2 [Coelomomyces lativittatus]|nr:EF-hand domain-containing member C2 [Coelomomyces lativittatus]KAJ1514494.1 EF-hand domain-containing member C2 [Coelomomyces lativittatus]